MPDAPFLITSIYAPSSIHQQKIRCIRLVIPVNLDEKIAVKIEAGLYNMPGMIQNLDAQEAWIATQLHQLSVDRMDRIHLHLMFSNF